ncbi:PIG-L family deacetylase [Streptomyces sp. NPDC054863]
MRTPPSRRAVVTGLVVLTAAGCSSTTMGAGTVPVQAAKRGTVSEAEDGSGGSRVMQILAHPDDDLYFMNPEVNQTIDANDQLVSVYLNSGESFGRNKVPGGPKPVPDVPGYAGARRQGLRQAYGLMATGDVRAPWTTRAEELPDGSLIEVNVLDGHPGVRLVFLGVRQHLGAAHAVKRGLLDLWTDPAMVTSTLPSTGSPVTTSHRVTRASLTDVLVHLLDQFRPTLVRTLDPDPDMQVHDATHRLRHDQRGYSDHPDHTAAALFAHAALARYRGPGNGAPYLVTAYRGYYSERWPSNLPRRLFRAKGDALNAYGGAPDTCDFAAGCGDYDVGSNRSYKTRWLRTTTLRYPTAAPQLRQDAAGRLTAFAVLGGQAAMWRESARGSGDWSQARLLGGDGLLPGLTATLTKDGRWQLYAERIAALGAKARDNRREIVTAEQTRRDGPFGAWVSLGAPDRAPDRGRRVGGPVVARAGDGTTWLFVRDWAKGVACRQRRADGRWTPWQDLGGADVQEGLSTVTDSKGCVHVFGSGHDSVHHWRQDKPGGPFTFVLTNLPTPGDPPTALARPDGSVLLAYREAKTATPLVHTLPADGGPWRTEHTGLVARGYGALALHPLRGGGVLLAARNNDGSTSLATLLTRATPRWSTAAGTAVAAVSLAADATGRVVLARLGPDATLRTAVVGAG